MHSEMHHGAHMSPGKVVCLIRLGSQGGSAVGFAADPRHMGLNFVAGVGLGPTCAEQPGVHTFTGAR